MLSDHKRGRVYVVGTAGIKGDPDKTGYRCHISPMGAIEQTSRFDILS
jgi:hypothetical protein